MVNATTNGTTPAWIKAVEAKKASRTDLIPAAWRLKSLPPAEELYVTDIPRTCGNLTAKEIEITETDDVAALLSSLTSGAVTAEAVVTAYCKRAAIAHQLLNCLTEVYFDEAIALAKEADAYLAEHKKPIGSLHGLPVSLKDQFDIGGKECNMGYASWIGRISEQDSVAAALLKKAGGIIIARTNLPQTIMWGEADNWVYGQTANAFNRDLTCGGSSGGEGALIGLKGSPLGWGTDLGGSVRMPAAAQGLYGLRPTMRRLPYEGASNSLLGFEAIESVIGPMARSLSGIIAGTKAMIDLEPWRSDHKMVPLPWREDLIAPPQRLAFAVYVDNGDCHVHPPVKRAVDTVVAALEKAGHQVVYITPSHHAEMTELAFKLYYAAGAADFKEISKDSGEPFFERLPDIMRQTDATEISVFEQWQLTKQRDAFRKIFLDWWEATTTATSTGRPYDGVIAPCFPYAGIPHSQMGYIAYTAVYNLLDYPACSFPVLDALDERLDPIDADFKPYNAKDAEIQALYDPVKLKGPPIALQLVGRRFEEEKLLGCLGSVVKALGRPC